MSFDVWNLVLYILIGTYHMIDTRRLYPLNHHHHHRKSHLHPLKTIDLHPSKRVEIPHPTKNNEYITSNSYRRQEVIHALNDDKNSIGDGDDDDIESLGKTVDASGRVVKDNKNVVKQNKDTILKQREVPAVKSDPSTKSIIDKIKEIQDRLYKRTGSKELEEKFKQMAPLGIPEMLKSPLTSIAGQNKSLSTVNNLLQSHNDKNKTVPANFSLSSMKSDDVSLSKARQTLQNEFKITDGSKQPDRRKIIPEEVVDKILEKFQQLRQEAKHMALLENQHSDKVKANTKEEIQHNPYASIGPARDNGELKNRTETNAVPIESNHPDPSLQMPVPLSSPVPPVPPPNIQSNDKPNSGVPLMFIKSGETLVPVFGNPSGNNVVQGVNPVNSMTISGNGRAQLNSNPGIALPSVPSNIIPMGSPQETSSAFMNTPPQKPFFQIPNASNNNNIPSHENMIVGGDTNDNNNFGNSKNVDGVNALQAALLGILSNRNNNPYAQSPTLNQEGMARCDVPGGCQSPTMLMNTQSMISPEQQQQQQQQPTHQMEGNENYPSTAQLINSIMSNAAGYSQLANHLMTDYNGNNKPLTGDQRSFNNLPMFPSRSSIVDRGNVESSNPANIQFNMQQNLAPNSDIQTSMNEAQQQQPQPQLDLQKIIQQFSQSQRSSNSPNTQEFIENKYEKQIDAFRNNAPLYNNPAKANNGDINDISDPPQDQNDENRFSNVAESQDLQATQRKSPDELLELAKLKSMQRSLQTSQDDLSSPVANIDQNGMGTNHMSTENDNSQRSMMNSLSGVDPSNLLDKIHGAQLKSDLLGAGDPNWFSPTYKQSLQNSKSELGGTPDDLLEMLRKQNIKMFHKGFDPNKNNEFEYGRSPYHEERAKNRGGVPYGIDPSLADEIPGNEGMNQHFDVQDKEIVEDNRNSDYVNKNAYGRNHGPISVLSDGQAQYKHGRMSMDSSNLVNSFLQDQQTYRNEIAYPNRTSNDTKPVVRASISKTLPEDNIELRINGRKFIDKSNLRSKIVDGKVVNIKGKTLSSKAPVKIELSHGVDKNKIINIVTQGRYNVTDDTRKKKRMRIPKPMNSLST